MNLNAALSKREEELVPYLISKRTRKEIADELFRSVRTIENHARNIFEKTEVTKNTELCIWWFVKHFSISLEALPKSMTALIFLILFCTATDNTRTIRSGRTRRNEVEYIIEA